MVKRRRVLFVITTSDIGGAETFVHNLACGLNLDHFSPQLCSLCPPGRIGEKMAARGIPVMTLDMSLEPRASEMLGGAFRLARLINEGCVDLLHCVLYRANVMGAVASRLSRRRVPVVAGQHSLTPMSGWPAALAARWTRPLIHRTVAVSEAVRRNLVRGEGLRSQRTMVIPNGVDAKRFSPGDREAARKRLGLKPTGVLVGSVGRLSPEKGFPLLLDAVSQLEQEGALDLVLVGDGPQRTALEEQARRLGLGDCITFLGLRDSLEDYYPALDLFVLPSLEEGSPMALLEAMASGCPVVATRVGGVPEIVEDGRSGLLVEPGSAAGLGAAIRRLKQDAQLRRHVAAGARRRIEAHFSLQQMIQEHEDLYHSLLAPSGTSSFERARERNRVVPRA